MEPFHVISETWVTLIVLFSRNLVIFSDPLCSVVLVLTVKGPYCLSSSSGQYRPQLCHGKRVKQIITNDKRIIQAIFKLNVYKIVWICDKFIRCLTVLHRLALVEWYNCSHRQVSRNLPRCRGEASVWLSYHRSY